MADVGRGGALRTIFTFFLALMVTAFVGVGVYTFHPPQREFEGQIRDLNRREQAIRISKPETELTAADRSQIQQLVDERDKLIEAERSVRGAWGRSTSIILVALATLAMAISLVRAEQLPVISNGLLLGGVFTMVYGVGWIIATDRSVARFVVMTVALVITVALGYLRFVGRRTVAPATNAPATNAPAIGANEGLAELERRVRELEQRLDTAATALGPKSDQQRAV